MSKVESWKHKYHWIETREKKKQLFISSPHSNEKEAERNLDYELKNLLVVSDSLIRQRRNCPPFVEHKALGEWGNSYLQASPSHPASILLKLPNVKHKDKKTHTQSNAQFSR